ncbi:hypothetical protein BHE74_00000750 [Ensete ventricosum]|nr:hypothetical protein GW17_00016747 [Ensete ventricosum]RWW90106.1 hypothetical protein BHE74_00000750 [Ensete ventricosum]RZR86189.1 hypothetical protein BHM03_00013335 [Ensete ventricosum]
MLTSRHEAARVAAHSAAGSTAGNNLTPVQSDKEVALQRLTLGKERKLMGHVNSHRVPSMAALRGQIDCCGVEQARARGLDLSHQKLRHLDRVREQRLPHKNFQDIITGV